MQLNLRLAFGLAEFEQVEDSSFCQTMHLWVDGGCCAYNVIILMSFLQISPDLHLQILIFIGEVIASARPNAKSGEYLMRTSREHGSIGSLQFSPSLLHKHDPNLLSMRLAEDWPATVPVDWHVIINHQLSNDPCIFYQ